MLEQAMDDLSIILGARFYLREGEHAIFGKHFRDLPALSIGHAGGVSCQLTMLPQLPALARSLDRADEAPAVLFDGSGDLPGLALDSLRLRSRAEDPVLAGLSSGLTELCDRDPAAKPLAEGLRGELAELRRDVAALPPKELGVTAGPAGLALTERYAVLLAAGACVGMWRHRTEDGVLADTLWPRLALRRLLDRLRPEWLPTESDLDDALFTELFERAAAGLGFGLDAGPVSRRLPE
jgi:hypothetical protein